MPAFPFDVKINIPPPPRQKEKRFLSNLNENKK